MEKCLFPFSECSLKKNCDLKRKRRIKKKEKLANCIKNVDR